MEKIWSYAEGISNAALCSLLALWVLRLTDNYMAWAIASGVVLSLLAELESKDVP